MLGAIIGDIVGSRFEFYNTKHKDFDFFDEKCDFTDDTVMTVAVAEALMSSKSLSELKENTVDRMRRYGQAYPHRSYGGMFRHWLITENPQPYNSFGNGSAMRISPVGFFARSDEAVKKLSAAVTSVTHNHPEGIKGAEAIAMAIYWAHKNEDKEEIFQYIAKYYYPELKTDELTYKALHENYSWEYGLGSVTCQSSVPQAIVCFHESEGFEDAIRLAVSIGGDSDTIAAMVGGIAEAYYGIPEEIEKQVYAFLPEEFKTVIAAFRKTIKNRTDKR